MERFLNEVFLPSMREKKYETLEADSSRRIKGSDVDHLGHQRSVLPHETGNRLTYVISSVVDRTEFHAFNHAGHYVFREQARHVNQLIIDFVKSL